MSYIPPGWTQQRLAAATTDDLSELPYEVQLYNIVPVRVSNLIS